MTQTLSATEGSRNSTGDYARIEKAITFLREHHLEQPELADVARQVHLSEFHFQRLFSRWAVISPKRCLQFLTLQHARQLLADSKPLLEASLDSGLFGPSRLHDLFVSIEGVTPGEFKKRGTGLEIPYGIHPTRFGLCLLATTPRGVCWLSFVTDGDQQAAVTELREHLAGAVVRADPAAIGQLAERIFSRRAAAPPTPLNLLVAGTNWQIKVWEALLRIPPGAVTTYGDLAARLGVETGARAVGNAVAKNPIAYLIPCHRVIRESGVIGDYRWGTDRKRAMLAWESSQR